MVMDWGEIVLYIVVIGLGVAFGEALMLMIRGLL